MVLEVPTIFRERKILLKKEKAFTMTKPERSTHIVNEGFAVTGASNFVAGILGQLKNQIGFEVGVHLRNQSGASRNSTILIENRSKSSTETNPELITDLISYYKLDESSGAVIDSHGSNNGTNFNATPNVAGKINTAYDFEFGDGQDYINLTDMDYVTANRLTVSAWVNPESTGHSTAVVVAHSGSDGTRAFHLDSTGSAMRFLVWNSGGTAQSAVDIADLSLGDWHHVVGVWDGTNIILYVDGEKVAATGQTGTIRNETDEVTIGNSGLPAHARWWDGLIDEVGIWDKALSDGGVSVGETAGGEIAKLYNSGNGFTYPFERITYKELLSYDVDLANGIFHTKSWFFSLEDISPGDTIRFTLGNEGIGTAVDSAIFGSFDWELKGYFVSEDESEG